jgi:NADH:ubiquinone oxidoreductase subunit E
MNRIEMILESFPNHDRENLLPILQAVQQQEGYIPEDAVVKVSKYLKIPTSKVYAVSTFYDQFRFTPGSKYKIRVCNGTACHMEGSSTLLGTLKKLLHIEENVTSKNRLFSLEATPCMGACGKSPVIRINEEFYTNVTEEKLTGIISSIKEKEGL